MAGQEFVGRRLEHFFTIFFGQIQSIEFLRHHFAGGRRIGPLAAVVAAHSGRTIERGLFVGIAGRMAGRGVALLRFFTRAFLRSRRVRRLLLLLLSELVDERL